MLNVGFLVIVISKGKCILRNTSQIAFRTSKAYTDVTKHTKTQHRRRDALQIRRQVIISVSVTQSVICKYNAARGPRLNHASFVPDD
jgi:hypothetical protein